MRKRDLPAGALFALSAALYAITRFAITFMRQERVWFWGMQEAQVVAGIVLVVSVIALALLFRRRDVVTSDSQQQPVTS